jgi:DNA-binding transcriptional ArsR family regulator
MKDSWQPDYCARQLRALAEPDRLRIIECLRDGPKNVGTVAASLGLAVVNVSHHFGVLRRAGLVMAEKCGRFVVYRLNPKVFRPKNQGCPDRIDLGCCQLELRQT